ncbi:hypothetical protein BDV93DRAFT_491195 [Ceratobasidium sp. AG-I]|nr:hypothetical protein BDV93DRAFT_491195 [Ceratobasidium sp. AG-I]
MESTTKQPTIEAQVEILIRDAFSWLAEWILSFVRIFLFILSIPRRVLPTLLHVAAFTTLLPPLLAISIGAGITVVNIIPGGWEAELWMQYGEQSTPFARAMLPALVPDQPYDIALALDVPLSADNLALGNFMTKLVLTDAKNSTVATANRPQALVLGKKTTGWIPFISATPRVTTVEVPLVENWVPSLHSGILGSTGAAIARGTTQKGYHAFIAVGRADAWKNLGSGQGKELSIARAVLHGRVKLSGIRGYFAQHTFILFILTSAVFFATSTGAALALYLIFAPDLSEDAGQASGDTPAMLGGPAEQTTPRLRVKPEEVESETDYSWTSGGGGTRVKLESDDDSSSSI